MAIIITPNEIKAQFYAVAFELVVPNRNLPAAFWPAIAAARQNDWQDLRLLCPVGIASFTEQAVAATMASAAENAKKGSIGDCILKEQFRNEAAAINVALFGKEIISARFPFDYYTYESGHYPQSKVSVLHRDSDSTQEQFVPNHACYLARFKNLPFQAINGESEQKASPEVTGLINVACKKSPNHTTEAAEDARQRLRDMGVLKPLEVNTFTLLVAGDGGTLHCSSPEYNANSAFVRVFSQYTLN